MTTLNINDLTLSLELDMRSAISLIISNPHMPFLLWHEMDQCDPHEPSGIDSTIYWLITYCIENGCTISKNIHCDITTDIEFSPFISLTIPSSSKQN